MAEKKKKESQGAWLGEVLSGLPADAVRDMSTFLMRVLGPLAEGGDYLSEKIRFYRYKSALKVLQSSKRIADDSNVGLSEVPIKFLVPFLEKCSLEEEDSGLIERWAHLLVSASSNYDPNHPAFVDILSQISSNEAILLRHIYQMQKEHGFNRLESLVYRYRTNEPAYPEGTRPISLDAIEQGGSFLILAGTGLPAGFSHLDDDESIEN